MTLPQSIQLPPVYEGTTWAGISSVTCTDPAQGDQPVDLTGSEIEMIYRAVGERSVRLALNIGGGLEFTNAAGGVFRVLPQILPLGSGQYYWELRFRFQSGAVFVPLVGMQEVHRLGVPS